MRLLKVLLLLAATSCFLVADTDSSYFTYQIGGSIPSPEYSTVTSTTTRQITNLAIRTSGQTWIQASLSSTTTPATLMIGVNPVGLSAGNYTGSVEVWSPNMSNTLLTIIYLTVTNPPPPLSASPSSLTFNAVQGSSPPAAQTLVIGSALTPGAMITSSSAPPAWLNAGWISVGTAPMSIPISINPTFTNLAPGTYTTSLVFQAPFTSQQVTVPITLNVSAPPPVLKTNANSLQFQYVIGGTTPAAQTVQVTSTSTPLAASVSLGASWLTATTLSGSTPFSTNIGVNVSGLAVGTYTGQATVATSMGPAGPPATQATINVTLTVAPDTRPAITSVVNGASFKNTIAPGTWITISGKNLATTTQQSTSAWLPTSLIGVSVQLSGVGGAYSLLVNYVSPTQINAFVPHEVSPLMYGASGGATVTVTNSNGTTAAAVDCEAIAPAFFVVANYTAAISYPSGRIVGTSAGMTTVAAGDIVALYGTGFGQTNPASSNVNGPITAVPLGVTPLVSLNGNLAEVQWAGMVGIGLYQINIKIPEMPGPGDYPVIMQIGPVSAVGPPLPVR